MRKFILSIFASLLISMPAHAANSWDMNYEECPGLENWNPYQNCPAGCYISNNDIIGPSYETPSSGQKCLLCPKGYYCPGGYTTAQQCESPWTNTPDYQHTPTVPGDQQFVDIDSLSTSIYSCYQQCDTPTSVVLGQIGVEKVQYNDAKKKCADYNTLTCVANATDDGTGQACKCIPGFSANTTNTECKAIPYSIILDFNGVEVDGKTQIERYTFCGSLSALFSETEAGTTQRKAYIPKTSWVRKFEGYFTAKTGGEQKINANGYAQAQNNIFIQCLITDANTKLTLYAHWTDGTYTVKFMNDTTEINTIECFADTTKKCQAISAPSGADGQQFLHWECEGTACPAKEFNPGDTIGIPTDQTSTTAPTLTLKAKWKDCPTGSYCTGGKATECPKGTTSAEGSTSKSACYIGGGKTIFKNADGSDFQLTEKLYLIN